MEKKRKKEKKRKRKGVPFDKHWVASLLWHPFFSGFSFHSNAATTNSDKDYSKITHFPSSLKPPDQWCNKELVSIFPSKALFFFFFFFFPSNKTEYSRLMDLYSPCSSEVSFPARDLSKKPKCFWNFVFLCMDQQI